MTRFPFTTHSSIATVILCLMATTVDATPVAIDLPAQPLTDAIKQLSASSGLHITADQTLLKGRTAAVVKGTIEPIDALRQMLVGSGLNVSLQDGQALITQAEAKVLKAVKVVADVEKEGSAEVGYKPDTAKTTGPWGEKAIQDTPYSIHSTSAALMENRIAGSTDRVLQYIPVATSNGTTANGGGFLGTSMRGFSNSEVTRNGIPMRWSWLSTSTEDLESIEVLTGLSGFLYGAGNVGGMTNLVSKRPTTEKLADVTLGDYGYEQYFLHADLGGPIDEEGKYGYRLNLLTSDGETMMRGQELARNMVSGAFDWHITPDLLLQFDASHETWNIDKPSQYLNIWGAPGYPSADDMDNRLTLTNDWTYQDITAKRAGTNLIWSPTDTFSLRAGYLKLWETRAVKTASYWIDEVNGIYIDSFKQIPVDSWDDGGYLYADQKFHVFGLDHKLTIGANISQYEIHQHKDASNFQELYYPDLQSALDAPEVTWPELGLQAKYMPNHQRFTNLLIGDDITFNEAWSAQVGINHAGIEAYAFNASGVATSRYDESANTPTVSLVFKPIATVTTYATYMRSLQAGEQVSSSANPPYTNAGEFLPPTTGTQEEVGAKTSLGDMLLTAALYRIDKANVYNDIHADGTQTRTQDGRQVHRGLELALTGKATDNLTLFGGANFIDAQITKTNSVADLGKVTANVPKRKISLYAEYRLPTFNTLYLTGGTSYISSVEYVPSLLKYRASSPGYAVSDLGVRYENRFYDKPTIVRLTLSNLADKHYYVNGGPTLGAPRTLAFSTTIKF